MILSSILAAMVIAPQNHDMSGLRVQGMPPNTIFKDVGTCDLTITSNNELAKTLTRQGFALIHCFWWNEALRSFQDAVKADPNLGIAQAGLAIAMSQPRSTSPRYKEMAGKIAARAADLTVGASPIEVAVIKAVQKATDGGGKADDWRTAFLEVIDAFPNAIEPKLIFVNMLFQFGDRYELENPRGVLAITEDALKLDAKSAGALHYHVHICEAKDPRRALDSAKKLTRIAVDSPHMVHMPGHIFYALGDYAEANAAFYEADNKTMAYARTVGRPPGQAVWDFSHNRDYWRASLVESGLDSELMTKIGGKDAELELAMRRGDNATIAKVAEEKGFFWRTRVFARGMLALEKGDTTGAQAEIDELKLGVKSDAPSIARMYVLLLEGHIAHEHTRYEEMNEKFKACITEMERMRYEEPPAVLRLPHEDIAKIWISMGQLDDAEKAIQGAEKMRPNNLYLAVIRGDLLIERFQFDAAEREYDKVIKSRADRLSVPVLQAQEGKKRLQEKKKAP